MVYCRDKRIEKVWRCASYSGGRNASCGKSSECVFQRTCKYSSAILLESPQIVQVETRRMLK